MENPVNVAIGVLIDHHDGKQRILITRRRDGAVLGGFWEFPGGKVEPGESPKDCLIREFQEEVGLVITIGEALPTIDHRYDHGPVRLHPFLCQRVFGQPQPLHVAECRWIRLSDLNSYRFPPANSQLINDLHNQLAPR